MTGAIISVQYGLSRSSNVAVSSVGLGWATLDLYTTEVSSFQIESIGLG